MQDFKDLKVWKKAHEVTLGIYRVTRSFPREEMFGLTSQLRRGQLSNGVVDTKRMLATLILKLKTDN